MTVPATARRAGPFTGTGVSAAFPFEFKVFAATDLRVTTATLAGAESTLDPADYSVAINPDQETSPGGTVTYTLATDYVLAILGDTDYTQELDLGGGGNFNPVVIENALDRTVFQIQQLVERNARVLSLGETVADDVSAQLPAPAPLALIGWNEGGTRLQNLDATTLASVVAYGNTVVVQTTATGTPGETFTLPSNPGSLNNIRVFVDGLVQRPTADFTWDSNVTLTAVGTLPAGAPVLIYFNNALPVGTVGDGAITESKLVDGAVTTAKLADDSVTAAKIAAGAVGTGELAAGAVTQVKIAAGAVGTSEMADGAITQAKVADGVARMTLTATQTASGLSVDFTGIPSWAKRVTVMFTELSTNGTSGPVFQFGAGSYKTTGYAGSQALLTAGVAVASLTSGFSLGGASATSIRNGTFTFSLQGANIWACSGVVGFSDSAGLAVCGGYVSLAGALDRLRLFFGGTDTADSGTVSALIEG